MRRLRVWEERERERGYKGDPTEAERGSTSSLFSSPRLVSPFPFRSVLRAGCYCGVWSMSKTGVGFASVPFRYEHEWWACLGPSVRVGLSFFLKKIISTVIPPSS